MQKLRIWKHRDFEQPQILNSCIRFKHMCRLLCSQFVEGDGVKHVSVYGILCEILSEFRCVILCSNFDWLTGFA